MKPNSKDILEYLNQAKAYPINYGWVEHSICVGNTAGTIAEALQKKGIDINPEKVRIKGYLHDIGKEDGFFNFLGHIIGGYAKLKRENLPDEYCTICLTHSFIKNDPYFTLSGSVFEKQYLPDQEFLDGLSDIIPERDKIKFLIDYISKHEFTLEERLVSLCDLMCYDTLLTLDQRIVNIISRHGTWENTQAFVQAAQELKAEIDQMLGHNLYDLFPEIKEHL